MKHASALILSLAAALSGAALAQELKIGYVNVERLQRESTPARSALGKLQAEFEKREKDLVEVQNRIKQTADKLDKDSPTLSDSERTKRQRELVDQNRDFERRRREYQEDLNQRRSEEVSALLERANRVIRQISDQERYDLILQDVVYASTRVDITDKVIKALNSTAAGVAASAPAVAPTK